MRQVCEMSNPVVIGGVGGSGTRVVAEIIAQMGIYIGDDLDAALDNLWFLLLFKRPKWFRKSQHRKSDIFTGLTLFTKAMFHQRILAWPELKFLFKAVLEVSVRGHNHFGEGRGVWPFVRAWKMLTLKSKGPQKQSRWGWKEPNTHLYLVYLAEYFQAIKYIHTIRNGLDMAFSQNQQQLYNWGPLFGVQAPQSQAEEPAASLKYWVQSNRRVFKIGEKLGREKFLIVNFDRLCQSPKSEIQKIVSFLNIVPDAENLESVFKIPRIPESLGRHRAHPIDQFDPADLDGLRELGFAISTAES